MIVNMNMQSVLSNKFKILGIGYNCILSVTTKVVRSALRGNAEALYILTTYKASRYEFIFTNLIPGNMRHFTSVMGVQKYFSFKSINISYITMKINNLSIQSLHVEQTL